MDQRFVIDNGLVYLPGLFFVEIRLVLAMAFVAVAAAIDLRRHRIPNWLVLAGIIAGLVWQWIQPALLGGGVLFALKGIGIGFLFMLPLYVLRATGAGDVKLMAMVGAFLGPWEVASAALLSFIAGGVLALAMATARGALRTLLQNLKQMLFGTLVGVMATGRTTVEAPVASAGKMPFGAAIAVGTLAHIVLARYGLGFFYAA